jgi:hypothetical protein
MICKEKKVKVRSVVKKVLTLRTFWKKKKKTVYICKKIKKERNGSSNKYIRTQ